MMFRLKPLPRFTVAITRQVSRLAKRPPAGCQPSPIVRRRFHTPVTGHAVAFEQEGRLQTRKSRSDNWRPLTITPRHSQARPNSMTDDVKISTFKFSSSR
jgi:hypothetical protein